ncbi:MAG: cytidine deaminase [Pseudomonadota bacterium]
MTNEEIDALIKAAQGAMKNAYVPYSNFPVGAAFLMEDGEVVTGCNIENASFGATICAERTAIAKAMSDGVRKIKAIAVTNTTDTKITPCGICRQVIYEFARDVPVYCCDKDGAYKMLTSAELLPDAFTLD